MSLLRVALLALATTALCGCPPKLNVAHNSGNVAHAMAAP